MIIENNFCATCHTRIEYLEGLVVSMWAHKVTPIPEHIAIPETEEQATARILAWRCSKALSSAGDLALHIRSLAINGKTERGETLPEWSAPMRVTAADDVDGMYAQLVNWVGFWSEELSIAPPSVSIIAWSNLKETQGFKAGTTPTGAWALIRLQTMWLALRADQIGEHISAGVYREDVVQLLGTLRGKYPLAPRPPKPISLRPCPVCEELAVGADWAPADREANADLTEEQLEQVQLFAVEVKCEACGFIAEAKASVIARWLW